jgi:hypothetical protein
VDEGKTVIKTLDARRKELQAQLETADEPPPLLHPEIAELYLQKVTTLAQALECSETRKEATEALRGLIDAIVLMPNQGELQIELKGNLAAMLGATVQSKRSPETGDLSLQVSMVAGARNRQYRRRCISSPFDGSNRLAQDESSAPDNTFWVSRLCLGPTDAGEELQCALPLGACS